MSDGGYVELLEDARDALYRLLRQSEPGTGLALHLAYNHVNDALEQHQREAGDRRTSRTASSQAEEWREQRSAWRRIPAHERDRLVIQLLGSERLTVSELTRRLRTELAGTTDVLYPGSAEVRPILKRLMTARELDRAPADRAGRTRYRYFRRTELSGPIADLERMLQEPEGS